MLSLLIVTSYALASSRPARSWKIHVDMPKELVRLEGVKGVDARSRRLL